MDSKDLRLELLKLTYTHGREAREAVERAKELEAYVNELTVPKAAVTDRPVKEPPKHLRRGNS